MTEPTELALQWPDDPYKGILYYESKDILLFSGREDDIEHCLTHLTGASTRILILHGRTASGKSSFLRAGLIPAIEERGYGYRVLRDGNSDGASSPLFIRCGADPVSRIAEALFPVLAIPEYFKPTAKQSSEDSEVEPSDKFDLNLLRKMDLNTFMNECQQEGILWKVVKAISAHLVHTLVIIIDQAEEFVTLNQYGDPRRRTFAVFLEEFANRPSQMKIIMALRREFFSDVFSEIQLDNSIYSDVRQYGLREISREDVLRAILLPTLEDRPARAPEAPYKKYRFRYEGELAEQIVDDLFSALPTGGALPTLQIVCRDLYDAVRREPQPWIIRRSLYIEGGHITGRVNRHISMCLRRGFEHAQIPPSAWPAKEQKWREVLTAFVRAEGDGTTKTGVVGDARLNALLDRFEIAENAGAVIQVLVKPENCVLRAFTNLSSNLTEETLYSLGHDVIALALDAWRRQRDELYKIEELRRRDRRRFQKIVLETLFCFDICSSGIDVFSA